MLATLAVALGLTLGEIEKPLRWARVWGGPTEGPTPFNLRIELVETEPTQHVNPDADFHLRIESDRGKTTELPLSFDAENTAYVALPESLEDPTITVRTGRNKLAAGRLHFDKTRYWQLRHSRSGWFRGKVDGALTISVGCREVVFALGHPGSLGISVTDTHNLPVATKLKLEFDGLEAVSSNSPLSLETNAQGRATVRVIPRDLSASVRVSAGPAEKPIASYFSSIPVAMSTLVGDVREETIVVDSLVPVARVYYALVNEQGRWASGAMAMHCDAAARCHGETPLGVKPSFPAWLMVGGEPSLDGPSVIGWPIASSETQFVPEAVTIRDQLLLDGKSAVVADAKKQRAMHFQRALFGLLLVLVILSSAVASAYVRARREAKKLAQQLPSGSAKAILETRPVSAALVFVLIVLGLAALAAWIKTRLAGG